MRIAVCDDDRTFLQQTKTALAGWNGSGSRTVVELFDNGDALLEAHAAQPFDVMLLDVVMPQRDGIQTAAAVRALDRTVKIVFLTASPEFAVASYSVKANNYLLKPLSTDALYACLNEFAAELRENARSITVRSATAVHRVEIGRIEYLEAQNKRVLFTLTDRSTITAIDPLYTYEDQLMLADGFFKCSRSYIVNIHHIDTYTQKEVRMRSGFRVPISRACQREFEAAYFSVVFGKAGDR